AVGKALCFRPPHPSGAGLEPTGPGRIEKGLEKTSRVLVHSREKIDLTSAGCATGGRGRGQRSRFDVMQPTHVDAEDGARIAVIEDVGKARSPDYLVGLIRRSRVKEYGEGLVVPGLQEHDVE